jgi:hypothetical protein
MKTNGKVLAAVAVTVTVAVSTVWAADRSPAPAADGWQHLAMDAGTSVKGPELARKINEIGRDGWELVTVTPVSKDGSTESFVYFFKKPLK